MWFTFCYLWDGTCEEVNVWEVINASNEIITEYFISIFHFKTPILNWKALWIRKIAISRVKLSKIAPKVWGELCCDSQVNYPRRFLQWGAQACMVHDMPMNKRTRGNITYYFRYLLLINPHLQRERSVYSSINVVPWRSLFSGGDFAKINDASYDRMEAIINHSIWWKISCFPVNLKSFWEPRRDANELEKLFLSFI